MIKNVNLLIFLILLLIIVNCPPPDDTEYEKPVIYLYPIEKSNISVNLNYSGKLICTYPEYNNGWNVTAYPDGRLFNHEDNKEYSYLFWEGQLNKTDWNIQIGFVIEGKKSKEFLQKILPEMGLLPKEYNEFIVYWLPRLEKNKYNLIYFAGDDYNKLAGLDIKPQPDSILRVFMVFKPLDKYVDIEEQTFKKFNRKGFTVIEWGGLMIE